MYYFVIASIIGFLLFLYFLWKKLKEDYTTTIIFNLGFMVGLGILVSYFISYLSFKSAWLWLVIGGIIVSLFLGIYRYRLRVYETIETVFVGLLPWFAFIYLVHAMISKNFYSLGMAIFIFVTILIYFLFNAKYKQFSWYRSQKAGFAGLMSAGILFLTRGVIAIVIPDMLSFVGRIDSILSGLIALIAFLSVYKLSKEE